MQFSHGAGPAQEPRGLSPRRSIDRRSSQLRAQPARVRAFPGEGVAVSVDHSVQLPKSSLHPIVPGLIGLIVGAGATWVVISTQRVEAPPPAPVVAVAPPPCEMAPPPIPAPEP